MVGWQRLDSVIHLEYILRMETKIQARVDSQLKADAERILSTLGMTTTDLMRMTLRQLVMRKGVPFDVRVPNEETMEALEEDMSQKPSSSFEEIKERYLKLRKE